jgi:hypothetical protein
MTFMRPRAVVVLSVAVLAVSLDPVLAVSGAIPGFFSLSRQQFLTVPQGAPIEPIGLLQTAEGETIVTGAVMATRQAWSSKIGRDGRVLWSYTFTPPPAVIRPEFRGAVSMPGGRTFLCGNAPHAPGSHWSDPFWVYLDSNGKQVKLGQLATSAGGDDVRKTVSLCARWGSGFGLVGYETRSSKTPGSDAPSLTISYWIAFLDDPGHIAWEKQIEKRVATSQTPSLPAVDGFALIADAEALTLSSTDNLNTEVLRFTVSGSLIAQRDLEGRFLLIHHVGTDPKIEVFGSSPSTSMNTIVLLGNNLEEMQQVQGAAPARFIARRAYRMSRSLVLFGSRVHESGEHYTSAAVVVDPQLESEHFFDFSESGFSDAGSIWAAAPTKNVGEFVSARSLVKIEEGRATPAAEGDFQRGAVLTFLRQRQ